MGADVGSFVELARPPPAPCYVSLIAIFGSFCEASDQFAIAPGDSVCKTKLAPTQAPIDDK